MSAHADASGAPCGCSALLWSRDARRLSLGELWTLSRYTQAQPESLWDGLDTQAILDCYWAAHDACPGGGYIDWQSYREEEPGAAEIDEDRIHDALADRRAAEAL